MSRNFLLCEGFLPAESFKVGCLLVDMKDPYKSRHSPATQPDPNDVIISHQTGYTDGLRTGANNSFAASLTSLVSLSCSKTLNTSAKVTSKQVNTYKLANSSAWFRRAIKDEGTRRWIEDQWYENYKNLFVVVGYHTLTDASVVLGADETHETFGRVQVPISAAMASWGVVLPGGGELDPKFSARHGENQGANLRFSAPGERICAIQYRKVIYSWFSSRNIDRAMLERENVWKSFKALRSTRNKKDKINVGIDDVIAVDLVDDTDSKEGKSIYQLLDDGGEFFLE